MTHSFPWVGSHYRDQVNTQSYGERFWIDGVNLVELKRAVDEGGDFAELGRFARDGSLQSMPDFFPAQVSYSSMESGTIKAWHLHRYQTDLWFVPPAERIFVGLLDTREESATYRVSIRLTMGAGKAQLLRIPPGVAHGLANLTSSRATVLYFVDRAFDAFEPDEHRLPFDILGADFWSVRPG